MSFLSNIDTRFLSSNLNKNWQIIHSSRKYDQHFPSESIVRILSPCFNKNKVLIDLGSGNGKNSLPLKKFFSKVILVDTALDKSYLSSLAFNTNDVRIIDEDLLSSNLYDKLSRITSDNGRVFLVTYTIDHMMYQDLNIFLNLLSSAIRENDILIITFFNQESFDTFDQKIFNNSYCTSTIRFLDHTLNTGQKMLATRMQDNLYELHSYISSEYIESFLSMSINSHTIAAKAIFTEQWANDISDEFISMTCLRLE